MCEDIRPSWLQFARRAQQAVAMGDSGYKIVNVMMLVGPNGDPVLWVQPDIKRLEPQRNSAFFLRQIIENLGAAPP